MPSPCTHFALLQGQLSTQNLSWQCLWAQWQLAVGFPQPQTETHTPTPFALLQGIRFQVVMVLPLPSLSPALACPCLPLDPSDGLLIITISGVHVSDH